MRSRTATYLIPECDQARARQAVKEFDVGSCALGGVSCGGQLERVGDVLARCGVSGWRNYKEERGRKNFTALLTCKRRSSSTELDQKRHIPKIAICRVCQNVPHMSPSASHQNLSGPAVLYILPRQCFQPPPRRWLPITCLHVPEEERTAWHHSSALSPTA
jgi:hypothetical protein